MVAMEVPVVRPSFNKATPAPFASAVRTAALDGSSKQIRCASPAAESVPGGQRGEETTWAPGNQWDRLEFTYVDTGAVAPTPDCRSTTSHHRRRCRLRAPA